MQAIGFDCLSFGTYRPMHYVMVLTKPSRSGVDLLPQLISGRHGSARRSEHLIRKDEIRAEMISNFQPNILQPLDPEAVVTLAEANNIGATEAYALAFLNAALSHFDRALELIHSYPKCVDDLGAGWHPFHLEAQRNLLNLKRWIEAGISSIELDNIRKAELVKYGFSSESEAE